MRGPKHKENFKSFIITVYIKKYGIGSQQLYRQNVRCVSVDWRRRRNNDCFASLSMVEWIVADECERSTKSIIRRVSRNGFSFRYRPILGALYRNVNKIIFWSPLLKKKVPPKLTMTSFGLAKKVGRQNPEINIGFHSVNYYALQQLLLFDTGMSRQWQFQMMMLEHQRRLRRRYRHRRFIRFELCPMTSKKGRLPVFWWNFFSGWLQNLCPWSHRYRRFRLFPFLVPFCANSEYPSITARERAPVLLYPWETFLIYYAFWNYESISKGESWRSDCGKKVIEGKKWLRENSDCGEMRENRRNSLSIALEDNFQKGGEGCFKKKGIWPFNKLINSLPVVPLHLGSLLGSE